MSSLPPLPNFLIIGAQKSATRWLCLNLGLHPDIFTADRELEFFNHNFDRGVRWYRSRFEGWAGQARTGEATPGYLMWSEQPSLQAARIDGLLPGVRIFTLLREPVDRAYSGFVYHVARGRIPPEADFLSWVDQHDPETDPLGLISDGWYARSLDPYLRRFGARLKVFLHESVSVAPREVYASACAHLGVDESFVPDALEEVRFSQKLPSGSPHSTGGSRRALTSDERSTVFQYFADDVAELENRLGIDLGAWRRFEKEDLPSRDQGIPNLPRAADAGNSMQAANPTTGLEQSRTGTSRLRQSMLKLPDHSIHRVGANTTRAPGMLQLELLRAVGLEHDTRLLEIGCGIGRLVYELADVLTEGRYIGFDIEEAPIQWLRENYGGVLDNFEFLYVPVSNARYGPEGDLADTVRFPVADASVDMICAFSVFTHMRRNHIAHYLRESSRVLTADGLGVFTFFAIGPSDSDPRLRHDAPFEPLEGEPGTWTTSQSLPERAIGFDDVIIEQMVRDAGLQLIRVIEGYWRDSSGRSRRSAPSSQQDGYLATLANSTGRSGRPAPSIHKTSTSRHWRIRRAEG